MKKAIGLFAAGAMALALSACGGGAAAPAGNGGEGKGKALDQIVVGFAQVGAESGWRTANTKDIQDSFKEANIQLKFSDAQQKQENQIKAIRSYIQQGVDYIAFSPVVQTGWDAVLNEAKAANIPVILTDRAVDSKDTSLYVTFLGSDFILEGKKAGEWLVKEYEGKSDAVNVVQLEGTTGSAPAIDRGTEAIEAAGKVPGKDIKIITVDAVKDGMTALSEGKINFIVECSPLLGKQLIDIVKTLNEGGTVEKRIVTEETTFTQEQAKEALPTRKY
mgnify:CR=1 FL=1